MILLPISGLVIAGLFSQGIKDGPIQEFVIAIHSFSASLSYILILVHIFAAFFSRIKGDGVWSSMVPILKEKSTNSSSLVKKITLFEKKIYEKIENYFSIPEK